MECKFVFCVYIAMNCPVLIETLWNVNLNSFQIRLLYVLVLIETLWNVNLHNAHCLLKQIPRINRNIVECKWEKRKKSGKRRLRINRNIVECKFSVYYQLCVDAGSVLIETLWNVNEHSDRKEWHKRVCINRNIVECKSGTGAVSAMPYAY